MKKIFLQGTQQESKHNTIYERKWCVQCTHQKQNARLYLRIKLKLFKAVVALQEQKTGLHLQL